MPPFFARRALLRTREGSSDRFIDIHPSLCATRQYGDGPYFRVELEETTQDPEYWGWTSREGEYEFIHPMKEGVEICFPYGTRVEEERGKGRLVGLALIASEQLK